MSNNAPEIRFKGFTDAWVQRKFSTIVNRLSTQSNSDHLPKVEFEDIVSGEGKLNKDISNKFDKRKGIVFESNNILYGKLRPYLKNWLFADFRGVALGDFWVFEANNSSPIFAYYLIQSEKYQEAANLSTGTKMPRSDWKTVSETTFSIPCETAEQTSIGNFFRTLDDTITLYKRKLDGLKELKKGYLQQMLPQAGENAPRLRFAGFSELWERRKLGQLGSVVMNRRIFKEQTSENGEIPFYKIGTFGSEPDAFISRELFEEYKAKYPYPQVGDVLISASGSIGRTVEYIGKDEYFQDSNIVWLEHDERLDNSFLKQFYTVVKWNGLEGSTIKRLYNRNILDTKIFMPQVPEQTCIGIFFRSLDEQILAQQNKLDKIKQLKAAYLQKMFI